MAEVIKREYKDRLFKFIFGNPEHKDWTLNLYNAVNGSSYTNVDDITLTTIQDVVYMGMKNDVSFLIADKMNLYEQQSSYNPNMPLRFLIYVGMVYSNYVEANEDFSIYSPRLQHIPAPRCVCFYNGTKDEEDRKVLRLSDAFTPPADVEVLVAMLNINYGRNAELLNACGQLDEYSWFVAKIRENQKQLKDIQAAVDAALEAMPEEYSIKPLLMANRAEVKRMCITEFNEDRLRRADRREGIDIGIEIGEKRGEKRGRAEGRAEGRKEGRAEGENQLSVLMNKLLSHGALEDAKRATVDPEYRKKLYHDYGLA